ncbi:hypothetical protein HIM_07850 [Hirsutella minnesotensis 3608]|uniref:Lysophospholipase n=1 Tax=Hirsutella minnesotensis 3608 TaxID=1043627 RepID=A0A0F7ZMX8_9HYPO|nr:hypothetical protein HIM_07850 [Hirsutella minnesotensis 3608]
MLKRMFSLIFVAALVVSTQAATAGTLKGNLQHPILESRAVSNAPNKYAPGSVECPETRPAVRRATGLSIQEAAWLKLREKETGPALKEVFSRLKLDDFDAAAHIDDIIVKGGFLPRIGIAVSGGGLRALMNGAGAISAFDNRTVGSNDEGHLGGILQASTYISGLSGGSWVVGSLYVQNFTTVDSIIYATSGFRDSLWQFNDSILEGPNTLSRGQYYRDLQESVKSKRDAGYAKTITDYWGRALSYQLVNASDGGPGYTFSSIADDVEFSNGKAPMPIVVALERPPEELYLSDNATVFEFNPWEMGSYDVGAAAFAPLKYVGSKFVNGVVERGNNCVVGFDNAGFVMGTSSSLFNAAFLHIDKATGVPEFLLRAINETLEQFGEENRDIAAWANPFYKYNIHRNKNANSTILGLVDGGEDFQNIPFHPLTLPERHVDTIFAVDSSADTLSRWPNGTALVATYHRSKSGNSKRNSAFPIIPDQNTFINLGMNKRPAFFGCSDNNVSSPLIVYLPNAPYTFFTNTTTMTLQYTDSDRDQIVRNGYEVVTMGNGTLDPDWPACVGCAMLARSIARTKTATPAKCSDCFARYCWNGTTNSSKPGVYEPVQIMSGSERLHVSCTTIVLCFLVWLLL